ncbi:MAG: hydrogenase maturation nickel metallochaperone HypA [Oscillospiraceae bacterium]|nr:hydrogenase maturation nickel metallochaperone HypA [Oscillospiraceae bacterium]
MHELALTEGIIQIVREQAEINGFDRVLEIRLRVGEYSGIVPECLLEFFPIASRGTPAEGAALTIQPVPAAFRCFGCGYEGPVPRRTACCPDCGSTAIRMTVGREFYVEDMKVE